jgi:hypothetical protein
VRERARLVNHLGRRRVGGLEAALAGARPEPVDRPQPAGDRRQPRDEAVLQYAGDRLALHDDGGVRAVSLLSGGRRPPAGRSPNALRYNQAPDPVLIVPERTRGLGSNGPIGQNSVTADGRGISDFRTGESVTWPQLLRAMAAQREDEPHIARAQSLAEAYHYLPTTRAPAARPRTHRRSCWTTSAR